jgi:hypothetical protein
MYFGGQAPTQDDADELYASGVGVLARSLVDGDVTLTSGATLYHAWPLSKNSDGGHGKDIVGAIDLSDSGTIVDADGIPAGMALHGLVSLVEDQAGSNDLAQATLSKRPELVYTADVNDSDAGLLFDGVDDYLRVATFTGGALTQPNDMFVVGSFESLQTGARIMVDGGGSSNRHALIKDASGDNEIFAGTSLSGSSTDTSVHVYLATFNGNPSKLWVDGGSTDASGNANTQSLNGVVLGARYDGGASWSNVLVRQYAVNNGQLADADRNTIGEQLATETGTTWTDLA